MGIQFQSIMKSVLLVALAFAAVLAMPEADAYYNRFPGYYNRNFNYYRGYGYSGYPFLEAQPTALIAPEDGCTNTAMDTPANTTNTVDLDTTVCLHLTFMVEDSGRETLRPLLRLSIDTTNILDITDGVDILTTGTV